MSTRDELKKRLAVRSTTISKHQVPKPRAPKPDIDQTTPAYVFERELMSSLRKLTEENSLNSKTFLEFTVQIIRKFAYKCTKDEFIAVVRVFNGVMRSNANEADPPTHLTSQFLMNLSSHVKRSRWASDIKSLNIDYNPDTHHLILDYNCIVDGSSKPRQDSFLCYVMITLDESALYKVEIAYRGAYCKERDRDVMDFIDRRAIDRHDWIDTSNFSWVTEDEQDIDSSLLRWNQAILDTDNI
jgi:hypothetical protein